MIQFKYTIKDKEGIHARPAGLLSKEAAKYSSEILIQKQDTSINARKIIALMGLCVKCGDEVSVTITGDDEETAGSEIKRFFATNL